MNHMTTAYIGLGSNMGNSEGILKGVLKVLANNENFCMPIMSSLYKTSPIGNADQPDFINAVVKIDTSLSMNSLLKYLMAIEKATGRKRTPGQKDGPRLVDCDILLYGREEVSKENLVVPHPQMTKRLFVMQPLVEVAPKAFIPGYGYAKEVFKKLEDLNHFESQKVEKLAI